MPRAAWVYLTQNTRSDASYGVDRRGPLEKSLDLLYANSVNAYPHPVIIFHEGDFTLTDQLDLKSRYETLEFRHINFTLPDFLRGEDIPQLWGGKFSIGYRHMIRFYSLLIYEKLWDEFDFYARMDDDSFLLSPIEYDIFEMMERDQLDYAYRVDCQDHIKVSEGFSEVVQGYLRAEEFKPGPLWDLNLKTDGKAPVVRGKPLASKYLPRQWNRWGYYNNFHATRLSFWRRPEVQAFLRFLDRTGGGYKYRWNDLIVQSAAVQIFAKPGAVRKLTDWDYEHRTNLPDGTLAWGGRYCRNPKQTVHCRNTK
jgi:alpha 1,2-mannosyltransferase